jgi:hypothetical protein
MGWAAAVVLELLIEAEGEVRWYVHYPGSPDQDQSHEPCDQARFAVQLDST